MQLSSSFDAANDKSSPYSTVLLVLSAKVSLDKALVVDDHLERQVLRKAAKALRLPCTQSSRLLAVSSADHYSAGPVRPARFLE